MKGKEDEGMKLKDESDMLLKFLRNHKEIVSALSNSVEEVGICSTKYYIQSNKTEGLSYQKVPKSLYAPNGLKQFLVGLSTYVFAAFTFTSY